MQKEQSIVNHARLKKWGLLLVKTLLAILILMPRALYAHQTPTTIVLLDVSPGKVAMEMQLPLSELELSFGNNLMKDPATALDRLGPQLTEYFKAHIHPYVTRDNPWQVEVSSMKMDKGEQVVSGPPYWEIVAHVTMTPPANVSTRKFLLDYDVIMHQVINHAAIVSIRNDWEIGRTGGQPTEAGVIHWDTKNNLIYPLEINLEKGSWWKGFTSMMSLGMLHIKEGTDHLLFLLALLLPATLLVNGRRWGGFGGARYSLLRLLKIVTSFTLGHSITLLIGALGWIRLPSQAVEILIAISILVSAIHAIYPIFPGKEMYIAIGFGLIHGLAFSSVLTNLNLGAAPMALSILGFNIGIEVMQLFVIVMIVPWLIILSRTGIYSYIRITGALFAGIISLGWIAERFLQQSNSVTRIASKGFQYAPWIILSLAVFALSSFYWVQLSRTFINRVWRWF